MLKRMLLIITMIFIAIAIACGCAKHPGAELKRSVVYTVRAGDTLWEIAEMHADLNTYSRIYMPVFMESIREANYDKFADNRFLQPGDRLTIYYFVKE